MKQVVQLAAFGCLLAVGQSKVLRWVDDSPSWTPPRQTIAAMHDHVGFSPNPTAAPDPGLVELELAKRVRNDNTCAYISGDPTNSLYCEVGSCVYNSFVSVMGCCTEALVTNCKLATTCIPASNSRLLTTNNGFTYFCGSSAYPECVTYVYASNDPDFASYTIFGCGRSETRVQVLANPTSSSVSTTSSSTRSTTRSSSSTSSESSSTTRTDTPTTSTAAPAPGPSPPPTGAIVGGVVGGVGAIALIGAGIFILLRRRKRADSQTTSPPAPNPASFQGSPPPNMYAQQAPPMQQHSPPIQQAPPGGYQPAGYPPGFLPVDNRSSTYKSPYDVNTGTYDPSLSSPPGSPPPHSPQPSYPSGTPLVQNAAQYQSPGTSPTQYQHPPQNNQYYPPPQQQGPPHHGYQQSHASELPAGRGDNELRELA